MKTYPNSGQNPQQRSRGKEEQQENELPDAPVATLSGNKEAECSATKTGNRVGSLRIACRNLFLRRICMFS